MAALPDKGVVMNAYEPHTRYTHFHRLKQLIYTTKGKMVFIEEISHQNKQKTGNSERSLDLLEVTQST